MRNDEAFRIVRDENERCGPSYPYTVQAWSVFYNSFQVVRGGFEDEAAAQAFITSGGAYRAATEMQG